MNFRLFTCHRRQKYPKINVASARKASTRANREQKSRKHRKKSSRVRRLHKGSYMPSNVFSKNFYPANYFFQEQHQPKMRVVGGNDHYGFLITARNPPQHPSSFVNHHLPTRSHKTILPNHQRQFSHYKVGRNSFSCFRRSPEITF
jgi:hypothetical protein